MKLPSAMDPVLGTISRAFALLLHILALSSSIGVALQCYQCNTEADCHTPRQAQCDSDFDACVIETSWRGNLYRDMTMSRSCGFKSECPKATPLMTPFCNQTEDLLTCILCCQGDFCNNGGSGKILRPPPYPPVPEPLVQRLVDNVCSAETTVTCTPEISWTEESTVVNVLAVCGETSQNEIYRDLVTSENMCNNQDHADSGFCITCCTGDDCSMSNSNRQSVAIVLLLACSLVRWFMTT